MSDAERWFLALPYRAKSGVRMVDIRASLIQDAGMGSRFVCATTPEDAERIVADHNNRAQASAASTDAVRAAAERLMDRDFRSQALCNDIETVCRAALAGDRAAEGLRAALEGLAMRSFFADGTFCWCDGPVDDPLTHQHKSWCMQARQALAEHDGEVAGG